MADQKGPRPLSIHDKTVEGEPWGDALQRKDSEAAIERFWRYKCVEIWLFVWSVGGPRRVPRVGRSLYFPAGPRDVQGILGFICTW